MDSSANTTYNSNNNNKKNYNKYYYQVHKKELSIKAKNRYKNDENFRARKKENARKQYLKQKTKKINEVS